ncbi:GNAT family N-acetyltransferase [Microbacterium sp. NPDC091313]
MTIEVRPLREGDRQQWEALFEGYRRFYRLAPDSDVLSRTWGWIARRDHGITGLAALAGDELVGIAHMRLYARPSAGRMSVFLDDLYTAPHARGRGVAAALVHEVAVRARDSGADTVRWITADDNTTARRVYDRVASVLPFVMYQMPPAQS